MKGTVKNKEVFAFIVTAVSILFVGITGVYAFERTVCNNNHSTFYQACPASAGAYGYSSADSKGKFRNGCDETGRAILNKCYEENPCNTFRTFLSNQANTCNSLSPQAKLDGCAEMCSKWINLYDGHNFSPCP